LLHDDSGDYAYLEVPPQAELRSCVGLVMAGMAMRARVGIGGLEEAVEILESVHRGSGSTRYRFHLEEERVVAAVEDTSAGGGDGWRTVVELSS
jgi:hypothetical protein